ncbi:hypothetical protein QG141_08555, partial [Kingella kingae]|uniref:hypothetical protein n=1 Tax=Kingella kingae TaxID=504 RepID=UPI002556408D
MAAQREPHQYKYPYSSKINRIKRDNSKQSEIKNCNAISHSETKKQSEQHRPLFAFLSKSQPTSQRRFH